jgi:hypothetical protein
MHIHVECILLSCLRHVAGCGVGVALRRVDDNSKGQFVTSNARISLTKFSL